MRVARGTSDPLVDEPVGHDVVKAGICREDDGLRAELVRPLQHIEADAGQPRVGRAKADLDHRELHARASPSMFAVSAGETLSPVTGLGEMCRAVRASWPCSAVETIATPTAGITARAAK